MPSSPRSRFTSLVAVATVLVGAAGAASATITTAAATTPPVAPCAIPQVAHTASSAPKVGFVNTTTPVGSVEVRGKLKKNFEVTVFGCLASGTPVGSVSYLLVPAPKSARVVALQDGKTTYNADGTGSHVEASFAQITTEKGFNTAIKGMKPLTIPGLKGTVYVAGSPSPLAILASKSGKKKVTAAAKQAAAVSFLKQFTSPYAPQSTK